MLFADYVAASGSTQKSLGLTLNRVVDGKPQFQDNFVTLANRAGFQTWWFSNQGQIGEYDTAIASIAKRADEVSLPERTVILKPDKNTKDEAVTGYDRSSAGATDALATAADCFTSDGLTSAGLRPDHKANTKPLCNRKKRRAISTP